MSPALLAVLIAAGGFVGFLGVAVGNRIERPAVVVAAVLFGVVLLVELFTPRI